MHGYELKVTLSGSKPTIYRKLLIPQNLTFEQLHEIIQIAMGWEDYHLYDFYIPKGNVRVVDEDMMNPGFGIDTYISLKKTIDTFLLENKAFIYTYDMGDNWEHEIKLTKEVTEDQTLIPQVIAWQGNCPPEDCGGLGGYEYLLGVINQPKHEDYENLTHWLEAIGYDHSVEFSLEDTNKELKDHFSNQ